MRIFSWLIILFLLGNCSTKETQLFILPDGDLLNVSDFSTVDKSKNLTFAPYLGLYYKSCDTIVGCYKIIPMNSSSKELYNDPDLTTESVLKEIKNEEIQCFEIVLGNYYDIDLLIKYLQHKYWENFKLDLSASQSINTSKHGITTLKYDFYYLVKGQKKILASILAGKDNKQAIKINIYPVTNWDMPSS